MDTKALWACSIIAVVAVGFALWFIPGRGARTRTVRTLQMMQNLAIDIDLLHESDSNALVRLLARETNTLAMNRKAAGFLKTVTDPYITNSVKLVSSDGLFRDAWGIPLCFTTPSSPEFASLGSELRWTNGIGLVFWSAGPNRTNDFGFGDDLFLHRQ